MVDRVAARPKAEMRAAILVRPPRACAAERRRRRGRRAARTPARRWSRPGDTVCAYVPVGSEPGSPAMLDALVAARRPGAAAGRPRGRRRALPLPLHLGRVPPGELVAAPLRAARARRRRGCPPRRSARRRWSWCPRWPSTAPASGSVAAPASTTGRCRWPTPRARLIAMVRDDEVVDRLPAEPHDVPMTHALTPGRGLSTRLTGGRRGGNDPAHVAVLALEPVEC